MQNIGGVATENAIRGNGEKLLPEAGKLLMGNSSIRRRGLFPRNGFRVLRIIVGMGTILMRDGMMNWQVSAVRKSWIVLSPIRNSKRGATLWVVGGGVFHAGAFVGI